MSQGDAMTDEPEWIGEYVLDANGEPVPERELLKWAQWMENGNRIVEQTDLGPLGKISTVFLGLDHSFSPIQNPLTYRPVLWETMIFGGSHDMEQWRYDTLDAARLGHGAAVAMVMGSHIFDETH